MLLLSLFFSCFILRSDRLCRNPRHCSLRVSWTSRNYHRVVLYGDVAKACSLQKFGFSKLLNSCCAMSTSLAAHVLDMLAYVCHSMTFYDYLCSDCFGLGRCRSSQPGIRRPRRPRRPAMATGSRGFQCLLRICIVYTLCKHV